MNPGHAGGGPSPVPPLISLLTDFGLTDPFVGQVKARILATCPWARIVDLTHAVPAFSVEAAAFWIEKSYVHFPPGTVHVCVVDPGVGTGRRILLVEYQGQIFLAPDNGLLAGIAARPGASTRTVSTQFLASAGLSGASATFHGRDLFAPLAAMLAAGQAAPGDVAELVTDWCHSGWTAAARRGQRIHGRIILVDNFGNYFSNIESISLFDCKKPSVLLGDQRLPWARTYGDCATGTLLALVNSFGVVEVACVGGRAVDLLGLEPGAAIEVDCSEP